MKAAGRMAGSALSDHVRAPALRRGARALAAFVATAGLCLAPARAAAEETTLADRSFEDVRQTGLENLEAGREEIGIRYLTEAALRPEAANDLDLLFLTVHLLRDACRIDAMRSLLPRARNAADLAARSDLSADAEALTQEAETTFQPVVLRIQPAIDDWEDLIGKTPTVAVDLTRPPSNPAHAACVPRIVARWNAQLAAAAGAHEVPDEVPAESWELTADLPLAAYALSWKGCGATEGGSGGCPTAEMAVEAIRPGVPVEQTLDLGPTLPPDERPWVYERNLPWVLGGAGAALAVALVATCLIAQPVDFCKPGGETTSTDKLHFPPLGARP